MKKRLKVGIITSRGGHLFQLLQLQSWWKKHDRFWVTFPGQDVTSLLKNELVFFAHYPESRHLLNAIKNTLIAFSILLKNKPDLMISCGAGIAPPFFIVGKLLGIKLVFIEPIDFIKYPSLSGRIVAPFCDLLLVQNKKQLNFFKHARYLGPLL